MAGATSRRAELVAARGAMAGCTRCPALVASRTCVVLGQGDPAARVLIVSDAPGSGEDADGVPLAGRAGALLTRLLASTCDDSFLTTLVKCRPPAAREASAEETAGCAQHLETEVALVRPVVVVALGGLVAGVLRGGTGEIRAVRGREEPCRIGALPVWLLPVFHPAAALYEPRAVEQLAADLARLPELLARGRPELVEDPVAAEPELPPGPEQLGLF